MTEGAEGGRKRSGGYIGAAVACALIAGWVLYAEGIGNAEDRADVYRILCDAFFVAGVFVGGVGALLRLGKHGAYDALGYGARGATDLFRFGRGERAPREAYHEYKRRKAGERKGGGAGLMPVGAAFLALALVALLLYEGAIP